MLRNNRLIADHTKFGESPREKRAEPKQKSIQAQSSRAVSPSSRLLPLPGLPQFGIRTPAIYAQICWFETKNQSRCSVPIHGFLRRNSAILRPKCFCPGCGFSALRVCSHGTAIPTCGAVHPGFGKAFSARQANLYVRETGATMYVEAIDHCADGPANTSRFVTDSGQTVPRKNLDEEEELFWRNSTNSHIPHPYASVASDTCLNSLAFVSGARRASEVSGGCKFGRERGGGGGFTS